jgi:hypothetical protein
VLQIAALPAAERALVLDAYRAGLASAFTVGAVIAGLGFLTVLFLPERPLRGKWRKGSAVSALDGREVLAFWLRSTIMRKDPAFWLK